MSDDGRMTVELYERDTSPDSIGESVPRGEPEVGVLAVIISLGDEQVHVAWDEERSKWEVEVFGPATVYHN